MTDNIYNFLKSFIDITEADFSELIKITTKKTIAPNIHLSKLGVRTNKIYLLNEGIVRSYVISDAGKEINKNLFFPVSFVASLTALIKNEPSNYNYETLTSCNVLEIDYNIIKELRSKNEAVNNLYIKVLETVFIEYEKRQFEFVTLNATQRYLKLKERCTNIEDLIPLFQIANSLNITPVQLSRIRKKLFSTSD